MNLQVGPKKVSHYEESSLKCIKTQFRYIYHPFSIQNEHKNVTFVPNIPCVTYFVTSSVAVIEPATWVKSMYMTKS